MRLPDNSQFQYQAPDFDELVTLFSNTRSWQEKYRHLMLLGKQIPTLAKEYRVEAAQVDGCESAAWLYHQQINGKHYFIADSDTRIVKGLIAILMAYFHGKNTDELPEQAIEMVFHNIGLSQQLSPSRTNGLQHITQQMQHKFVKLT
ncbi:SufE family protein [Parashewanella curva]|uniref:SufE family protein n=1 Tax=Parashewanella curva TaxID=2338552 RepID=A0A3L8PV92_9GAMM|nr:SufE family protein [Parashewanella curva]RLV59234.1 SufE family protein [Parashewanella curva]